LLQLHEGSLASKVAQQVGVSLRTIRRWVRNYRERMPAPVLERIGVGQHSGRPAIQGKRARRVIEQVWQRDPRRYGFRALVWTVPMLRCLIQRRTGQPLGQATVRRTLRRLRYRYKRPRLVLARRSPTWRQAKGGLSTG
jgi:transposase